MSDEGKGKGNHDNFYKQKAPKQNLALVKKVFEDSKKRGPGRPPHFEDPELMEIELLKYIIFCEENGLNMTITGLALFLGFCDRVSLYEYEKKPEFTNTIKKARALIEAGYEGRLHYGSAGGPIFALKNFGWTDEQVLRHTGFDGLTINKNYEGEDPDKKKKK